MVVEFTAEGLVEDLRLIKLYGDLREREKRVMSIELLERLSSKKVGWGSYTDPLLNQDLKNFIYDNVKKDSDFITVRIYSKRYYLDFWMEDFKDVQAGRIRFKVSNIYINKISDFVLNIIEGSKNEF